MLIYVFWLSAALVIYAYIGYPVLVWILARMFGRQRQAPELSNEQLPLITLLIAAHNEEPVIGERLKNALATDYPADKLQILVASDGSADATCEIVREYEPLGVELLDYKQRRGKAAVLNDAMLQARGEIVLFSDANTFNDLEAARRLVRWFADPRTGAVCGKLVLVDPESGRNVDGLYWKYETFLKKCEGKLGALLGANGAIYALRREWFVSIPTETIIDDFVIPLLARQRHACQIVYDVEAIATEETPATMRAEFRRRARIGAGGFQSIALLWKLLLPKHGWLAFSFLSHKVIRWCCPFLLILLLATNVLLVDQETYQQLLAAQVAFYAVSAAAAWLPGRSLPVRLLRMTTMFVSMNLALLVGFWRWLSGQQRGVWQRTSREAVATESNVVAGPAPKQPVLHG